MKILTGAQIAQADRFTIENEPVESINLMERAAEVIAQWVCNNVPQESPLCFFIGKGNNGGDGLAVARMLFNVGYTCQVYLLFEKKELSEECRYNLGRLPRGLKAKHLDPSVVKLPHGDDPDNSQPQDALVYDFSKLAIPVGAVIVDALLGSGVRGEVQSPIKEAIGLINALHCRVISIDLPSGMLTEYGNADRPIVRATTTLTLEFPKLALLLPEAGECGGEVVVLPIELAPEFMTQCPSPYRYMDESMAEALLLPRAKFANKGSYGHALLICGSEGMAGSAVLATGAALRSGCGLVSVHLPREERGVIHATNPSALVSCDPQPVFSQLPAEMGRYTAVGVGCGLGQQPCTVLALEQLLGCGKPLVLDADALNLLAVHPRLQSLVPPGTILTPHVGELRRLVGVWVDDAECHQKVIELATRLSIYVVLKGCNTVTCTPEGVLIFNSTGNAGMAKGGSGDVLTGVITALLARGYSPRSAALLGVYLHGKAGDKAAEYFGMEGMNSSDIIDFING